MDGGRVRRDVARTGGMETKDEEMGPAQLPLAQRYGARTPTETTPVLPGSRHLDPMQSAALVARITGYGRTTLEDIPTTFRGPVMATSTGSAFDQMAFSVLLDAGQRGTFRVKCRGTDTGADLVDQTRLVFNMAATERPRLIQSGGWTLRESQLLMHHKIQDRARQECLKLTVLPAADAGTGVHQVFGWELHAVVRGEG